MANLAERIIEGGIFGSRWLQAPMYVGLVVAQTFYCWKFGVELWHLIAQTGTLDGKHFLMVILELIDFTMVANLIAMVVIGGYATFISKLDIGHHPDRPEWLDHIDPGSIKVKLASSLIGISSIQLLQSFISVGSMTFADTVAADAYYRGILWQIVLHVVFVISALLLALTDMVMMRRHRAGDKDDH